MSQPEATDTLASPSHSMLHRGQHNVMAYGAVGDAVHDDTQAFQDAIDAGFRVYVPTPPSRYLITDKLTVSSATGLHMTGSFNKGSQERILCNNFPTNTDLFELTNVVSNPTLQLEDLFFDSVEGTAPRDFYRETVQDSHGIKWRNVAIHNFDGYGFNTDGFETVAPRFEDVNVVGCGAGGMKFDYGTAVVLRNCRFTTNGTASGFIDLDIRHGAGYTVDSPVFDGFAPGALNFTRMKVAGPTNGVTIINPYVEWTSGTASGTLRDFWFVGVGEIQFIGGLGQVCPIGGAHTLTAVELDSCAGVMLLHVPIETMMGQGPYSLKVINSANVWAWTGSANLTAISVDSSSAASTTINGYRGVLRYPGAGGMTLSGTTDDCEGASWAYVTNASPTNMSTMTLGPGVAGHEITLIATNGNTTLVEAAGGTGYFKLRGGASHTMASGEVIKFVYDAGGGGQWREIGR